MSDLEQHIKRINDKLQQLLKNYKSLQKDNERQTKLIAELKQAKENDAAQMSTLQEQIEILKAATGQMNDTDKKAFERTINRHIREIDKCISLLSD